MGVVHHTANKMNKPQLYATTWVNLTRMLSKGSSDTKEWILYDSIYKVLKADKLKHSF